MERNEVIGWILVGVAAVVVMLVIRAVVRINRAQRVWHEVRSRNDLKCARCGYDLRAACEICPECGEPVPKEWAEARLDSRRWPPPRD